MTYQPQIVFNIDKKSLNIPKRFQKRGTRDVLEHTNVYAILTINISSVGIEAKRMYYDEE